MTSPQDLIKKFKTDFDAWFNSDKDEWENYTVEDTEKAREEIKEFWVRALHSLAEAQKEKALEIVRRMQGDAHWLDKLPMGQGYDKALSEVEEALAKQL